MKFFLKAGCQLDLTYSPLTKATSVDCVKFNLYVSDNLQREAYLDEHDVPNENGCKALTNVLVQSLIGNIHAGHAKGYWKDSVHLRYVIDELERGFVALVKTGVSEFHADSGTPSKLVYGDSPFNEK
jgi:hypothetical protein